MSPSYLSFDTVHSVGLERRSVKFRTPEQKICICNVVIPVFTGEAVGITAEPITFVIPRNATSGLLPIFRLRPTLKSNEEIR